MARLPPSLVLTSISGSFFSHRQKVWYLVPKLGQGSQGSPHTLRHSRKRGSPAISCGRASLSHPEVAEMGSMVACPLIGTPSRDMQPSFFRFGLPARRWAKSPDACLLPPLFVSSLLLPQVPRCPAPLRDFDTVALPSPAAMQLVCGRRASQKKAESLRWGRPLGRRVPRSRFLVLRRLLPQRRCAERGKSDDPIQTRARGRLPFSSMRLLGAPSISGAPPCPPPVIRRAPGRQTRHGEVGRRASST